MKKQLLLLLLIPVLFIGCSKSGNDVAEPIVKQNEKLIGKKFRRQTWFIGNQSAWQYDVLEFKTETSVMRETRLFNDTPVYSTPENLKWEKSTMASNKLSLWFFPTLNPYEGTITDESITFDMGGNETRIYTQY